LTVIFSCCKFYNYFIPCMMAFRYYYSLLFKSYDVLRHFFKLPSFITNGEKMVIKGVVFVV